MWLFKAGEDCKWSAYWVNSSSLVGPVGFARAATTKHTPTSVTSSTVANIPIYEQDSVQKNDANALNRARIDPTSTPSVE
jgi:hypothetical protein